MALLNRFLRLLEWVEKGQNFIHFLSQPTGVSTAAALLLYGPFLIMGCDSISAATLSCTAALTLFCLLEKPRF